MSLATLLLDRDAFERYYNCAGYSVDDIPLKRRQHYLYAFLSATSAVCFQILYAPCIWAMYRLIHERPHLPSCYPLMLFLAIADFLELCLTGYAVSYLMLTGTVFCANRWLVYAISAGGMLGWFASNTTVILLAINRCVVLLNPEVCNRLFRGQHKVACWLMIPILGSVAFVFATQPPMFNAIGGVTYANPHQYYLDLPYRHGLVHMFYNWFIVVSILIFYAIFISLLFNKVIKTRQLRHGPWTNVVSSAHAHTCDSSTSRIIQNETKASAQVVVTCVAVLFTSLGFIYSDFFNQFGFVVMLSYIFYQGTPALIYISMNRTIRRRIMRRWIGGPTTATNPLPPSAGVPPPSSTLTKPH